MGGSIFLGMLLIASSCFGRKITDIEDELENIDNQLYADGRESVPGIC